MKYEKEFREVYPETIGETDKEFDKYNYIEFTDKLLTKANEDKAGLEHTLSQGRWKAVKDLEERLTKANEEIAEANEENVELKKRVNKALKFIPDNQLWEDSALGGEDVGTLIELLTPKKEEQGQ